MLTGGTALTGGVITVSGTDTVNTSGSYVVGNTYTLISGSSLAMNGGGSLVLSNSNLGFTTLTSVLTSTAYQVTANGVATPGSTPTGRGAVSTVWADASKAPTHSNWYSNSYSTADAQQIPGAISNVHFSGLNGSAGVKTTLGADIPINSLNIDSGAPAVLRSPAATP